MSRAGKFIPGGGGRKKSTQGSDGTDGPIRAENTGDSEGDRKRSFPRGGRYTKPVDNKKKPFILILSAIALIGVLGGGFYFLVIQPQQIAFQQEVNARKKAEKERRAAEKKLADEKNRQAEAKRLAESSKVTVRVRTRPSGATVRLGSITKDSPAEFADIGVGEHKVVITKKGFTTHEQSIIIPTPEAGTQAKDFDMGVIPLTRELSQFKITTGLKLVKYKLIGPDGYSTEGILPDQFEDVPAGAYTLETTHKGYTIQSKFVTDAGQNKPIEVVFPYAQLQLRTKPSGATIRMGMDVIGQTDHTIDELRPGDYIIYLDKPGYRFESLNLTVSKDDKNIEKVIELQKANDFVNSIGVEMVWLPKGFYAGKYEITQRQYAAVMGVNPSTERGPDRPVETVTWDDAIKFCEALNRRESTRGPLPKGFYYTLPLEWQWSYFAADADPATSILSHGRARATSENVGSSAPNSFGLYDTVGNVWEWCLDPFDANGQTRSARGGGWLNNKSNFRSKAERKGQAPRLGSRFIGFRLIALPPDGKNMKP